MKVKELYEFYDPSEDQTVARDYDDTRRPRLTMKALRKMRISKDHEKVDNQDYLEFLPTMYGATPDEDSL